VRRVKLSHIVAVTVVIAVAITVVFLFFMPSRKIVVYAYSDAITGIDPSLEDDTGIAVIGVVYETLTYYNHLTGQVEPRLAERWESNEDGTEWTFFLRRDVVFHDGTAFNATAVKISVERARDLYREKGRGLGYIWDAVEEIEIIDEYTVKFKLSYPQRLDLLAAAAYAAYIFSPSVLEKSGASSFTDEALEIWFNQGNAIGTGPYKLVGYDPRREVRLEKFNEWWGWKYINNPNAPDVVTIKIITDPTAQYHGLVAGEIDVACCVPRGTISDLLSRGFRAVNLTTYRNFILFFNTKRYPTNITYFRLAIAHALNLTEVVQVALKGLALEASGYIPHYFPGYVEGLTYEYNLTRAREYLELSGVNLPVEIELLYQVDYEETRIFAEIFKSRMHEIGIKVKLDSRSWDELRNAARGIWRNPEETPHIIIADWWPTIPSPFDYLYTMFHSESKEWNFAGYENPELDELLEQAWELEAINYTKALELYRRAQEIIYEECVAIGLWDDIRPFIYSSRVEVPEKALNPMYMFVVRFEYISVRS